MGSPDPPANFAAGRTLPYDNGRAQPQEFFIRAEAKCRTLKPAQIANLEGVDKKHAGDERLQERRFIVYNYRAGFGCITSLTIINKLYFFVNNQFIPNGIGIAKLKAGSALLD